VDDLLAIADRTSMAHSLEVRVPYLDHTLVEFMAGVPGALKIGGLQKKRFLRLAFRDDLPREILDRRKSGFSLPVARWLREDLRGLLDDTLSPARLGRDGLFEPAVVADLQREHYTRKRDWSSVLWALLMFHLWADHYAA
jgi:asparagine synthase (glutamine-hydrolysing)